MSTEEELHDKVVENTFNTIIAENFPSLGKERPIPIPEAHTPSPNRKDQKRNSLCHSRVKIPNIQNKI